MRIYKTLSAIDLHIARCIVEAQLASDGGKYKKEIRNILPNGYYVWIKGYDHKNQMINKAINLINKSKNSFFRYYVESCEDPNDRGRECYLVFFSFHLGKRRWQISFHNFDHEMKKYISKKKKFHDHWIKNLVSRTAAYLLGGIVRDSGRYYVHN